MRLHLVSVALLLWVQAITPLLAAPARHALLIGIGDYRLGNFPSLAGPPNDLRLMARVLREKLQVPGENIVTLLDRQATHSAIREAFVALASRVTPGDFVYIHYAGHGSYAVDRSGDERSGFDQTWVAYGARSEVFEGEDDRDILDDDIERWLAPIQARAEQVVFVSDSCHSATVSRGPVVVSRTLPPDPRKSPPVSDAVPLPDVSAIRIGAARDWEPAVEVEIDGASYGLFTWHWAKALQAARPGDIWRTVFQRAYTGVITQPGTAQRPQIQGDSDRGLFGDELRTPADTVPVLAVDESMQRVILATGSLTGATRGSVYVRHGADGETVDAAELELIRVRAFESVAKIRRGSVQRGDLVGVRQHVHRFEPLRVLIRDDTVGANPTVVASLRALLADLPGYALTESEADKQLILQLLRPAPAGDDYRRAGPAHTLPLSFANQPLQVWVLDAAEQVVHERLQVSLEEPERGLAVLRDNLRRHARVQDIRRLVMEQRDGLLPELQLYLLAPDGDCGRADGVCREIPPRSGNWYRQSGPFDAAALAEQAALPRGTIVTFDIVNSGVQGYYVYLFNLGADGGLTVLFPHRQMHNADDARLDGRDRLVLSGTVALRLSEAGQEAIKLLATRNPIDPYLLEVPELRTRGEYSPLERLLVDTLYERRGAVTREVGEWGADLVEFLVE